MNEVVKQSDSYCCHNYTGMVTADEEGSCDKDDHIFVDGEDAMYCYEDFLVIMVELICCSKGIFLSVPS